MLECRSISLYEFNEIILYYDMFAKSTTAVQKHHH
ncbi:MAG: hypothetical protein ACI8RD_013935, partial [Bacillariaceae sp.]